VAAIESLRHRRARRAHRVDQNGGVSVNDDCRHYVMQTTRGNDKIERCKMDANEPLPFGCPDGCVFYEPRRTSSAGWQVPRSPGDPGGR
jgi:hypothetical protein